MHPSAIVEGEVGADTRVWAFAHVMQGAQVGADCSLGEHVFVESGATLADAVTVKNGVQVWDGVSLLEGAFVGPNVTFTNDLRPRSARYPAAAGGGDDWLVRTEVGRGASIGGGSVIIAGVTIGPFALVAAGSVVTHDVAAHALVAGSPATARGWVCACAASIAEGSNVTCATCGRSFARVGPAVEPVGGSA